MFIGREDEIKSLEERYHGGKAELIVIYGRRRVGKTELIKKFIEEKDGIMLLARTESEKDQLKRFSALIGEEFKDGFLLKNPFRDWDAFFTYITEKTKDSRIIIAIDEFPFIVNTNKAIPSIMQDYWDNKLKNSKIFLVLCGSSIAMMIKKVLGYKSPLYGRRTGQLKINPLKFKDACKFFQNYSLDQCIEAFAILGGTPGYLAEFDDDIGIFENIKNKILGKDKFLFEDAEFILKEELDEPKFYFSVLKSIAFGKTRLSEIINETGLNKGIVGKYISVLTDLDIIKKEVPATEKYPHKSRNSIYLLKDNFFKFWFRFIFQYIHLIDRKQEEKLLSIIKAEFNRYVSFAFEDVCREFLASKQDFDKIGKWWYKENEIDIIALNERAKEILFGECKWKDRINAETIIKPLAEKSKLAQWNNEGRKECFAVFAKSFSLKIKEYQGKTVYCYDLKDLKKW